MISHDMLQLGLVEKEVIKADLKWVFEKTSGGGVYNSYQHLPKKRDLVIAPIAIIQNTPKKYFAGLA